ncbi:MAG: hypothetical protein HYW70_00530 [Candidatus Nealsonbacteria bacterium]|nr:hypothetical protein [Candidatus Nealsonbacteria bacterium]
MNPLLETKALIDRAKRVLILLPENYCLPSLRSHQAGDIFCSAAALYLLLKKIGKGVNLLTKEIPQKFQSLGSLENNGCKNIVITINAENKEISEMKYEKSDGALKILLSFNRGAIDKNDLFVSEENSQLLLKEKPDLLIAVGAKSLEELPQVNLEDVLRSIPIINIDNQTVNEGFGQVNLIGEKALAISEIITKVTRSLYQELVDKDIANYLLAGIISATSNFRAPKMRSQTFESISWLIEKGGDYQKTTIGLRASKNINQIKLLGKVFEKINFDEEKDVYTASVSRNDFFETKSEPKDLAEVITELRMNLGQSSPLLLLWESHASPPAVRGVFYSPNQETTRKITESFGLASNGEGVLFLIKEKDLNIAKEKIFDLL